MLTLVHLHYCYSWHKAVKECKYAAFSSCPKKAQEGKAAGACKINMIQFY